jgi:integrase
VPPGEEASQRRFRVLNVPLPQLALHSREIVPVLVDDRTGLPLRLALRWVMRSRRLAVSEKTLSDDLRAAGLLYAFCEDELNASLDDLFADGHRMDANQLDCVVEYLRTGSGGGRGVRALSTTGQLTANIERFLRWLAKPMDRGGRTYVPSQDLVLYHEQLSHNFSSLRAFRSRGQRKQPLSPEQEVALERLIGPERRSEGQYLLPLRFGESNPWRSHTRLRNWIAYRLARELGLRRGEVGKIRIDDIRLVKGHPAVAVRRRPHDPADTRISGNRPKVKTVERELPLSDLLAAAIRQYQHTLLPDGGRRGSKTPYLLVAANGAALSGSSLDAIWISVSKQLGRNMSWHVLRHTWAEEVADDLLKEHEGKLDSPEVVMGILRELGGWAPISQIPFVYIRDAMKKRGNEYLRRRNAKFDMGDS